MDLTKYIEQDDWVRWHRQADEYPVGVVFYIRDEVSNSNTGARIVFTDVGTVLSTEVLELRKPGQRFR
jgi:hypothetical protein